jgi:hypothetical protein
VDLLQYVAPFQVANPYGLFAVMTTERQEIVFQGSNDGVTWLEYEFPFKPGDEHVAPRWAAPYQPRLDWQLWFAALDGMPDAPWVQNFALRLLQGSPGVLRLIAYNPFPNAPPKYIRAELYDYQFTDWHTLLTQGTWWRRQLAGDYLQPMSLSGN